MAVSTSGGTINSLINTPQAKDDNVFLAEDYFLTNNSYLFDVMSNDLGGKAKVLWSIDGVDSATDTNTIQDLISKYSGAVTSNEGAKIEIVNGVVKYTPSTIILNKLQALNVGVDFVDTFTYTIKLANGTLSYATAHISFVGTNDAAIITGQKTGVALETNQAVIITGTLNATDVDNAAGFQAATILGSKGSLSITTAGAWTFTANSAFDALNVGDSVSETFSVLSVDGTTETITVTITGTNDRATAPLVFTSTGDTNDFDSLIGVPTSGFNFINGTNGNDTIIIGTVVGVNTDATTNDRDIVNAGTGNDFVNAGSGGDRIYGGDGDDHILGRPGNDLIYGQAGNDLLNGDDDNDDLYGGTGDDSISAHSGSDKVYGGSGNDTINAGAGDDLIVGGFGADILVGAGGANTFMYIDLRDTGDTITTFISGLDKINFSVLDANSSTAGNQTFGFSNTTLLANSVTYFYDGTDTIVQADTDGNVATAELQIQLIGNVALTAADLIL